MKSLQGCDQWWNCKLYECRGGLYGFIISLLFNKKQSLCLKSESADWVWVVKYILITYRDKYLSKFCTTLDRHLSCVSIFYLYWNLLLWYYKIKLVAYCSNLISQFWFWLWEDFLFLTVKYLYDELYQYQVNGWF